MESDRIDILLQKYDQGMTSLKEELELRNYFIQENVATHLEIYKPLFMYYSHTQKEQFIKEIILRKYKPSFYKWGTVVASIILILFIFFEFNNNSTDLNSLSEDEQIVYKHTVEALNLIATNFNKVSTSINTLEIMTKSLDKGNENIYYLEKVINLKNRILKN